MKKLTSLLGAIAISTIVAIAAAPQAIIVGHGNPTVNIIDMKTKESLWQYDVPMDERHCNSVALLKDGKHIAISTTVGAKVISIETKETVWEHRPEGGKAVSETHAVVPFDDGSFAVFIAANPLTVLEVSAEFEIIRELKFTELTGGKNPHGMIRLVSLAKDGNYLVPWSPLRVIYKMNREGQILETYPVHGFGVSELNNGNLLFGTADRGEVMEYNPQSGYTAHKISHFTKDGERAWIQCTGQNKLLGKNRYLVTNWTGHVRQKRHQDNKTIYIPTLMIVNRDGEILWDYTIEEAEQRLNVTLGITGFHYSKRPIIK